MNPNGAPLKHVAAALVLVLLTAGVGWGLINPRFTPRHLVDEADVIFAGEIESTADPLEWKMAAATTLKGKPAAAHVLRLGGASKDHLQDIQATLKGSGREPGLLFFHSAGDEKRAFLHVAGEWLDLKAAGEGCWDVRDFSAQMDGVYAGGTDMLIRMSQYLAQDPDADVPTSAAVRWQGEAKVKGVPGEVAGLVAVERGKDRKVHLFVASSAGDRLYHIKGEEALEDVTAASRLDIRSRAFAWVDLDGNGLADLVSWDGAAVLVRLACEDGTYKPAPDGFVFKPAAPCAALAPLSVRGKPGVLLSASASPIVLVADAKAGWTKVDLPRGAQDDCGVASPCVVADLDNDGYADVLQPCESGGLLWKGGDGGFAVPVKVAVATGKGIARIGVGDFNQDGALDVFLAGPERSMLWENDGKGNFTEVLRHAGSLAAKGPPGAAAVLVCDLNHDGRQDLCLAYVGGEFLYHFSRGFRCFGEEREVRLTGLDGAAGEARPGLRALAAGDFNGDGSLDLAAMGAGGDLCVYFNQQADIPAFRLRLPKGVTGPVTAACWIGDKHPVCTGAVSVPGSSPATWVCARYPGPCTIQYRMPGKPQRTDKVTATVGPKDVVLGAATGD